eukprot:s3087_g2.t1
MSELSQVEGIVGFWTKDQPQVLEPSFSRAPAACAMASTNREEILDADFIGGPEAMAAFEQDGFFMFDSFLRPTHLEELRHAFDERMRAPLADDCEVDLGVNWASPDAEPFLRALRDERLLDFLAQLCGPNFVAMRLELFEKRPGSSNLIPWHQDTYTTHVGFSWDDATASAGQRPHPVTLPKDEPKPKMAMKLPVLVAFLSLAHLARSDENDVTIGAGVTPVQKVLDLLASMKVRGEEEKQKEALQYAKYEQFCRGNIAVARSHRDILRISSDIADAEATLPDLTKDIDKWTADKDKATTERQEERLAYTKAHGEYLKAIQNVGKAYTTLKSQDVDKEQAKSFIQFPDLLEEGTEGASAEADALSAPSGARAAIQAFLAENSEISVAAEGPGKAKGYEFGSDKILDLLKKLEGKFKKERMTMEKEEMDKKHSYELLLQTWKSQIAGAEKTRDDKVASKLKKEQTKASKEKDLADLKKLSEDDKKYLEDVKATCTQKAEDFKERPGLRGEELAAIDKAADAIRGTVLKVSEPCSHFCF